MRKINRVHNLISESFSKDDFQLYEFLKIAESKMLDSSRRRKIVYQIHDLGRHHDEIECIIKRINKDYRRLADVLPHFNVKEKTAKSNLAKEEDSSIDDYESNIDVITDYFNLLTVDVKSLYIWLLIFLDKLPDLATTIFKKNQGIKDSSYRDFFKTIKNSNHPRVKELYGIFNAYDKYFQDIRKIRHHYTIHRSNLSLPGVTTTPTRDYFAITLSTRKKNFEPTVHLSNNLIGSHLLLFKSFLRDFNEYLCKNINEMPFK